MINFDEAKRQIKEHIVADESREEHVGMSVEAFEEIVPALDTERIDLQILLSKAARWIFLQLR